MIAEVWAPRVEVVELVLVDGSRHRLDRDDAGWHRGGPELVHGEEYRLTTDLYVETIRAFCAALALERPVVMGCSIGGRIVLPVGPLSKDCLVELEAVAELTEG